MPIWVERLEQLWWYRLPASFARFSRSVGAALGDGAYLTAWPITAAVLPPIALVTGLYLGTSHAGYTDSAGVHFLYSPLALLVLIMVSQHGAALGLMAALGFALGDIEHSRVVGTGFLDIAAARLLADLVLALLLGALPLTVTRASTAIRSALRSFGVNDRLSFAIAARAISAFVLVYLFVQSAPLLLQAVTKWPGGLPMTHGLVEQMKPLSVLLGLVAGYVAALRASFEAAAERSGRPLAPSRPRVSPRGFAGRVGSGLARGAALTFVCGSLLQSWNDAIGLFAAFAGTFVLRAVVSRVFPAWPRRFAALPTATRVGGVVVVAYLATKLVVSATYEMDNTFMPPLGMAVGALLVFALVLPPRNANATTASRSTSPSLAGLAATIVVALMVLPSVALAGNCTSVGNCQKDKPGTETFFFLLAMLMGAALPDHDDTASVTIDAPDDLTIQVAGRELTFVGRTNPPGRESDITWEVPGGQNATVTSGSGARFTTQFSETGVKQVVARIEDQADDVLLAVFKTPGGTGTIGDLLDSSPPLAPVGPRDYTWYRSHDVPNDDDVQS